MQTLPLVPGVMAGYIHPSVVVVLGPQITVLLGKKESCSKPEPHAEVRQLIDNCVVFDMQRSLGKSRLFSLTLA